MSESIIREIPISPEYVQHWGLAEAGRELIANYLDSEETIADEVVGGDWAISDRIEVVGGDWVLSNRIEQRLPVSILVLGESSKTKDDDSVGQFGEGLKLAIVVLLRAGYAVTIRNDDVMWIFEFKESENWGNTEVLQVEEVQLDESTKTFEILVEGAAEAWDELHSYCLEYHLRREASEPVSFSNDEATIYFTQEADGAVFVGGVYIENESKTRYTLDLRPSGLELNRERSSIQHETLYDVYKRLFIDMAKAFEEDPEFEWLGGYLVEILRVGSYGFGIIRDCYDLPFIKARATALKARIHDKVVVYTDNEEAVAHAMGNSYVRLQEYERKILETTEVKAVRFSVNEGFEPPAKEVDKLFKFIAKMLDDKGLSEVKNDEELLRQAKRMRAMSQHWISTITW